MEHTAVMILTVFDTVILPDVDYRLNIGSFGEAERERLKADDGHCVLLPIRSLKGKTEEGLGFTGTGEGMAVHAVCLIEKY